MADVVIRGMDMGNIKTGCPFRADDGYGSSYCVAGSDYCTAPFADRGADCPVVVLPKGHGRLIDADALVSNYSEEINKLEEWAKIQEKEGRLDMARACHLRSAYLAEAKLNIEAALHIVPAEGGTNE